MSSGSTRLPPPLHLRPCLVIWLALGAFGCRGTFVKVSVDFVPPNAAFVPEVSALSVVAFDNVSRVDAGPTAVPGGPTPNGIGSNPTFSVQAPTGATVTVLVSGLDDGGNPVACGSAVSPPLQAGTNALTVFLTQHCNSSADCDPAAICAGLEMCNLKYGQAFAACASAPGLPDGGSANASAGTPCGSFSGQCDGHGACLDPLCGNGVLDPGEQCDNGPDNSDSQPDHCRTNCLLPHCGDGVTDPDAGEICDADAGHNGRGEGCNATCTLRGLVTTLAGTASQAGLVDGPGIGQARFSQPYGITVLGNSLYVVDTSFKAIRRIDLDSGYVSTVAGGTMLMCNDTNGSPPGAGLCGPEAILPWDGGLLISDFASLRLLSLSPTLDGGVLSTFGGQLARGFGLDSFMPGPLQSGLPDGSCQFGAPHGMVAVPGALYTNTAISGNVGRVDLLHSTLTSVWSETAGQIFPQGGMATLGGLIYTTDVSSTGSLYALDPARLDAGLTMVATMPLDSPDGVCTDGVSLYVVSSKDYEILQVEPDTGAVSLVAGGFTPPGTAVEADGLGKNAAFFVPQGCVYDPRTHALYVTDNSGSTIREIQ